MEIDIGFKSVQHLSNKKFYKFNFAKKRIHFFLF